jgi:hypothetical protein
MERVRYNSPTPNQRRKGRRPSVDTIMMYGARCYAIRVYYHLTDIQAQAMLQHATYVHDSLAKRDWPSKGEKEERRKEKQLYIEVVRMQNEGIWTIEKADDRGV